MILFNKIPLNKTWIILVASPLIVSLYTTIYGQTITSENNEDENIFFSELGKTLTTEDTTANNQITYSPWGCKFTLTPLDFSCGKEEILPPPPDIIKEQVEILNFLRGRKERLDDRELMIVNREKELSDLEQRLEQKIDDITKINNNIQEAYKTEALKDTEAIAKLVSYYEKIPPANAAIFFNQMDIQTATMILTRMNSRKASALLANLEPQVAINITENVAKIKYNREEYLKLPNFNGDGTNLNGVNNTAAR